MLDLPAVVLVLGCCTQYKTPLFVQPPLLSRSVHMTLAS